MDSARLSGKENQKAKGKSEGLHLQNFLLTWQPKGALI
jgi:hypothetical protein